MTNRSLLHHTKLEEFARFAEGRGFRQEAPRGIYEVLRLKNPGRPLIFYRRDRADHITATGEGLRLVFEFLRTRHKAEGSKP